MKKITRSHKPLILITNDDGIQAKGIREVADFLKPLGDILIVAPDAPRSGQSSAITVTSPLRMKVVEERDGFSRNPNQRDTGRLYQVVDEHSFRRTPRLNRIGY